MIAIVERPLTSEAISDIASELANAAAYEVMRRNVGPMSHDGIVYARDVNASKTAVLNILVSFGIFDYEFNKAWTAAWANNGDKDPKLEIKILHEFHNKRNRKGLGCAMIVLDQYGTVRVMASNKDGYCEYPTRDEKKLVHYKNADNFPMYVRRMVDIAFGDLWKYEHYGRK